MRRAYIFAPVGLLLAMGLILAMFCVQHTRATESPPPKVVPVSAAAWDDSDLNLPLSSANDANDNRANDGGWRSSTTDFTAESKPPFVEVDGDLNDPHSPIQHASSEEEEEEILRMAERARRRGGSLADRLKATRRTGGDPAAANHFDAIAPNNSPANAAMQAPAESMPGTQSILRRGEQSPAANSPAAVAPAEAAPLLRPETSDFPLVSPADDADEFRTDDDSFQPRPGATPANPHRTLTPLTPPLPDREARRQPAHESRERFAPEPELSSASDEDETDAADHPASSRRTQRGERESDLLFTNKSPTLAVETSGPRTVLVGKPAAYTISVSNVGAIDANEVVVSIDIPSWTELVQQRASLGAAHLESDANSQGIVRWTLPRLAARSTESLKLEIVPRSSRPFDLSVTWTFAPPASLAQIEVQEPKLDLHLNGPAEMLYGETRMFTIAVHNPGTGDAENVVVNLLPVSQARTGGETIEIGLLRAGARKTIEVELTAREAGAITVRAQGFGDGGLRTDVAHEVAVRRARLEARMEGPAAKFAGTEAAYNIRVTNTGDAPAGEVTATVALPRGAEYLASSEGGRHDAERNQIIWTLGAMRPGAVKMLEFQCVLATPGENRLEIRAQAADGFLSAEALITEVEALADLKLAVHDPRGPIQVGADAVYEIRVTNRGSKGAEEVDIVAFFSEGIEPVAVQGWRGEIAPGQIVLQTIPRIDAGQEVIIKITARAERPGSHVFRAEVECPDPETRLAAQETTRYYGSPAAGPRFADDRQPAAAPHAQPEIRQAAPLVPPTPRR